MPDITAIAGRVAGILALAGGIPYIIAILRKQTKPNKATWWIWTVVGFTLGASYYSSGADHTIWVPVSYIIGPFVVAILSLKYGEGGWTRFDRICLLGAVISVALWWMSNSPLIALCINLFIDFMGALPTIRKSYYKPEGEDRSAWIIFLIGNTVNLFAVEKWTFAIAAYPIYMFVADCLIVTLLLLRPRNQKKA